MVVELDASKGGGEWSGLEIRVVVEQKVEWECGKGRGGEGGGMKERWMEESKNS